MVLHPQIGDRRGPRQLTISSTGELRKEDFLGPVNGLLAVTDESILVRYD